MGSGSVVSLTPFFYVQDERYFAKDHMDVRREALQSRKAYQLE